MIPNPSPAFIRLSRNPSLIEVHPRESAKEIAARIRAGVKVEPIVRKAVAA